MSANGSRSFVAVVGTLASAAVIVVAIGSASGCGQTEGTSNPDAGDAMQPAEPDARVSTCFYDLPDGAPQTCPADGKTRCLSPDGCNSCLCRVGNDDGGPPMFTVCTGHACSGP